MCFLGCSESRGQTVLQINAPANLMVQLAASSSPGQFLHSCTYGVLSNEPLQLPFRVWHWHLLLVSDIGEFLVHKVVPLKSQQLDANANANANASQERFRPREPTHRSASWHYFFLNFESETVPGALHTPAYHSFGIWRVIRS